MGDHLHLPFNVSGLAILIATPPALLTAFVLAYHPFPGRRVIIAIFNTLLSVPAVVVSLTLNLVFSCQGPLGDLKLLFTQTAMVWGQVALCFPLLVAMGHAAVLAAYGRIIAEVGRR